jgi:hypothetical protein
MEGLETRCEQELIVEIERVKDVSGTMLNERWSLTLRIALSTRMSFQLR